MENADTQATLDIRHRRQTQYRKLTGEQHWPHQKMVFNPCEGLAVSISYKTPSILHRVIGCDHRIYCNIYSSRNKCYGWNCISSALKISKYHFASVYIVTAILQILCFFRLGRQDMTCYCGFLLSVWYHLIWSN
jgi:hypothetical protein